MRITVENGSGGREVLVVDTLLVATGREPVSAEIGASEVGLTLDRGFIRVDELYRTGVEGISAIGDVITVDGRPHPQLAHVSSAEGIVAGRTHCGPPGGSHQLRPGSGVHVLRSRDWQRGADRGRGGRPRARRARLASFPFNVLGRAKIAGETEGFVKIVAEKRYGQVLGVHIIGARATEVVAEAAAALRLEATVEELVHTIHAHPTMAEAIGEAAHAAWDRAIHL